MNDLRLIILIIGLCVIALIYFWETRKQRNENRRQTVNYIPPGKDVPELNIKPQGDSDPDYAAVISDLNEALNKTRQQEDEAISRMLNAPGHGHADSGAAHADLTPRVTDDLFPENKPAARQGAGKDATGQADTAVGARIISLFISAPEGIDFSADEIFQAAGECGLMFGELDIFHHHGSGAEKMVRPLFSVADMYEPGSFDPDNTESRRTRGLTLFMCLPTPVEDARAFELMLDSARKLADLLGGRVLGPDREPLNKEHIRSIYKIIHAQA